MPTTRRQEPATLAGVSVRTLHHYPTLDEQDDARVRSPSSERARSLAQGALNARAIAARGAFPVGGRDQRERFLGA